MALVILSENSTAKNNSQVTFFIFEITNKALTKFNSQKH
jgi:hypothetical protein